RTGTEACANLVAQAAGPSQNGKQLALIGEEHLLSLRAVAQPEPVVEPSHRFTRRLAGPHGTEAGEGSSGGPAGQKDVRRRLAADADVGALPMRLALDVETRPPTPDQF